MKKILLAVCVLLLLSACTATATATATEPPAPPTTLPTEPPAANVPAITLPLIDAPQLTQFTFLNENDGWGATEDRIVRTNDGGVTWYDATPPVDAQFGYAPFVYRDAQTAFLLLPAEDYTTGTLHQTRDGGTTWTSNPVPFSFASLQFLDASTGFALAALGAGAGSEAVALFQTTDGGVTWTRVFINDPTASGSNDSLPLGGQKTGFAFLDASRGWVGGSIPMDNYIYLYATQDGGATWSETNLALPAGYEISQSGNDGPQFFSASEGILLVNLVTPADPGMFTIVYRTTDGGQTWIPGTPIPRGRPTEFRSFNDGVAWVEGQFYVTRDAGQTWGAIVPDMDFSDSLVSFQFATDLIGWVLTNPSGSDPVLYKTTDGGATWTLLIE